MLACCACIWNEKKSANRLPHKNRKRKDLNENHENSLERAENVESPAPSDPLERNADQLARIAAALFHHFFFDCHQASALGRRGLVHSGHCSKFFGSPGRHGKSCTA